MKTINEVPVKIAAGTHVVGVYLGAPTWLQLIEAARALTYPVRLVMPCGAELNYDSAADVPLVDMPCPCGDASHWLIKVKVVEEVGS
jgi:hypothetical protein